MIVINTNKNKTNKYKKKETQKETPRDDSKQRSTGEQVISILCGSMVECHEADRRSTLSQPWVKR